MVAGADDGELQGGGRSSGEMRVRARGHGKASWGMLQARGEALSAVVCSSASSSSRSHGSDMAGGEELSGSLRTAAREVGRVRGEGETMAELTAGA